MDRQDGTLAVSARVLIVAGSDSSGGAGIARDVETVTMFGLKAAVAITAVTAQSNRRVTAVQAMEPALVMAQIEAALEGGEIRAVKIGMLANAGIVAAVADMLERHPHLPVVLDPVLASTSGRTLLEPEGVRLMISRLLPRGDLVTPNVPELAMLTGLKDTNAAMERLLALGIRAALIKGGHANDPVDETALRSETAPQSPPSTPGETCRAKRGDEGAACSERVASPSSGPSGHLLPKGRSGSLQRAPRSASNIGICSDLLIRPDLPALAFESPRYPGTLRGTGCMLASAIACGLAAGRDLEASIRVAKVYVTQAFREVQRG
ncbi:hydroxymethylpyrimidine/phosphomethylpyrimidine kinase [Rhizobium sp. C4]|uniref:hydroxymethylpyrimidine/phosphomethylpyrimidine kinase n=1 Tax=Rhizobium sp. C4 TaxID=1349800 RepID=UPI001E4EAEBB|nr:hydroxymethylpyrimidine/phosphomethylpyrimidine kinase [Rhizobium sp. C4]MCD2173411.1 hydroxymethylpyrimidine/phosphomethylpyrimidine kinase [Rhizobium sp. C4]